MHRTADNGGNAVFLFTAGEEIVFVCHEIEMTRAIYWGASK
jgi:hypothetical protein